MRLSGQVALVTGAGQGIGRAVALALAREGADVAVNDVEADRAERTAAEVAALGRRAVAVPGDVADPASVQDVVLTALERLGRVDVLVNNAGVSPKRNGAKVPVWEMDPTEWQRVVDVNLTGAFHFIRALAPHMMARRRGNIVNMASQAAREYVDFVGCHYHATKAGLVGLTRAAAGELAPYGIRVNAVAPGRIRTELALGVPPEVNERFLARVPLGTWGEPEDVARAVVFLVSDEARYLTGVTLDVNGGAWMG